MPLLRIGQTSRQILQLPLHTPAQGGLFDPSLMENSLAKAPVPDRRLDPLTRSPPGGGSIRQYDESTGLVIA
jgi:hypothetical protein